MSRVGVGVGLGVGVGSHHRARAALVAGDCRLVTPQTVSSCSKEILPW